MNFSASRRELFFALVHAPPDFGGGADFRQGEAEGFDDHPAVVADFFQRVEGFVPRTWPCPGVLRSFSEM